MREAWTTSRKLLRRKRPDDLIAVLDDLGARDREVLFGEGKELAAVDHQSPAAAITIDVGFNE